MYESVQELELRSTATNEPGPRQKKNGTGRLKREESRAKKSIAKRDLDSEKAPPRTTLAATQINRQMFCLQLLVKFAQLKLKVGSGQE